MLRISGYGQTGPYRDRPGFGVVAEAMGGLRHLTGEPGRVPVRGGVSIGDTLASLHGVIGVLMAMQHRHATVSAEYPKGRGQVIDVALYEAVFNCMESLLPEYGEFGAVREAAGSALPGIAPTNAYRCADGGYAIVAGNGDSIFPPAHGVHRPARPRGRSFIAPATPAAWRRSRCSTPPSATGPRSTPSMRCWPRSTRRMCRAGASTRSPTSRPTRTTLRAACCSRCRWPTALRSRCRGFVPKMSLTPASHRHNAPALGADTDAVLKEIGLSAEQIAGAARARNSGLADTGHSWA